MSDDRLKIAVFIDFDNIEIGVKTTLGTYFDIGSVLEAIKERGEIVTKVAYGDWTRAGEYGRALSQHAVHMVQRNLTPGGDKNGADINLALDALEMAFTHNHINSFVIISGDSDFISLVEKLKQYDRKVFVVGGRAFTSVVMQKNCTEFIAYENIVGRGRASDRAKAAPDTASLSQAMPLVRRALKLLTDREVVPQLGLLKSTLLQLDSAFSEREYGAGSFRDFVQKLAKAGYVTLKGSERSFHVELKESGDGGAHAHPPHAPAAAPVTPTPAPPAASAMAERTIVGAAPPAEHASTDGDMAAEDVTTLAEASEAAAAGAPPRPGAAEAFGIVQKALARAVTPRWPLYVRQVKQLIRTVEPLFDERRYGFGSLVDALKHCQREGLLRLERDRQGIIRVWPGPQFQKSAELPMEGETITDETATPAVAAGEDERGPGDEEPDVIDAELRRDEPAKHPGLPYDEHEGVARAEPVAFGREDLGPRQVVAEDTSEEPRATGADRVEDTARDARDAGPGGDLGGGRTGESKARGGRRRAPATGRPASPRTRKASGSAPRKTTAPQRAPRARKPKGQE